MNRWLICLVSLLLLAGCGGNEATKDAENRQSEPLTVKNSTFDTADRQTGLQISKHLVELASSIPEVKDATAVVLGKYAIVGIDVDENIDRSQVGSVKYAVAEALKSDPYGAKAVVIADPDLNARLRKVAGDIKKGKPVQGIMNELAEISGRLMPEIPAEISDPQRQVPLKNQNNKLNEKETKNLKKKQEEQSNHHLEGKK